MGYDMFVQGAPDDDPNEYLRRNIFGMDPVRQALVRLGMGFHSEVPEFPDGKHLSSEDFQDGEPVTEKATAFVHVVERTLADHGAGADHSSGIPLHKFGSNDSWHVTAGECTEALTAYDTSIRAGERHPEEFRDDVIPFLRTAARYEGFRVH